MPIEYNSFIASRSPSFIVSAIETIQSVDFLGGQHQLCTLRFSCHAAKHNRKAGPCEHLLTKRYTSVLSQKFVGKISPRSGRHDVAHGASRGSERPPLPPPPPPAQAGEGWSFYISDGRVPPTEASATDPQTRCTIWRHPSNRRQASQLPRSRLRGSFVVGRDFSAGVFSSSQHDQPPSGRTSRSEQPNMGTRHLGYFRCGCRDPAPKILCVLSLSSCPVFIARDLSGFVFCSLAQF